MNSAAASLFVGLMMLSPLTPAQAQAPSVEGARGAIAGYAKIIILPLVCDYAIPQAIMNVTVVNIKALESVARLNDGQIQNVMDLTILDMIRDKKNFCGKRTVAIDALIVDIGKRAFDIGGGSAAGLVSLPVAAENAKSELDTWSERLDQAIFIEAISDECGFKLTSRESLAIDRVQYFWRGAAGATSKEFKDAQDLWAERAKADRARFCSDEKTFRHSFETILKSME